MKLIVHQAKRITIPSIDLTSVSDGTYLGTYELPPVGVCLSVCVREHKIESISLLQHENGLGSDAETIIEEVIQEQSLEVDTIAGVTVSSKCILMAIQNAIEGKQQR